MVAEFRWLRGVQRLILTLGDLWLQSCGGCEEYRVLYLHWETYGCRVAVVVGAHRLIPTLGDLWLQSFGGCEEYRDLYLHWESYGCRVVVVVGVHRLIPTLGDLWLQSCGGCEEYRVLYLHWETYGCRVSVVARSTETYTYTGRTMVAGLRWLRGVQRLLPALGDL